MQQLIYTSLHSILVLATKRQQEVGLAVSGVQVLTAMGDATSVTHTPAFCITHHVVLKTCCFGLDRGPRMMRMTRRKSNKTPADK
jgi:hypothetical protein